MSLGFTGERIVPGAVDCEPTFAQKMYQEHVARYAFAAQLASGADVLDVGCGVGYGSQWLGKSGARSVLGFDLSAEAIEHARLNYFHPAVAFKVQDATLIERDKGYDLVTCFELIEHVEKQEVVLDLIKSALREDGVLAISTPRPLDDIRTHFHVHEMSFEELYGQLKDRFKYVEPFFELNCFTSYVGRDSPVEIDRIVSVSDRIAMNHADYFVFLASDSPLEGRFNVEPVLTLNDDSYILTLEKDVNVLRRAENDHVARIADLEREKSDLAAAHGVALERASALSAIHDETQVIRTTVDQINHQVANQLARLTEARSLRDQIEFTGLATRNAALEQELAASIPVARLGQLEQELATARGEVNELRRVLLETQNRLAENESRFNAEMTVGEARSAALAQEADQLRSELVGRLEELEIVRHKIVQTSEQLAAAQTDAHNLHGAAERLPAALERASSLENELNALRYRLDHAEATLARFRRSFSWALTRPLRWVWRNYRKLVGRSLPQ